MAKKNSMFGLAKESVGIGVFSMAGMSAMGAVKGMAPAESAGAFNAASTGVQLANVGQMSKVAMAIPETFSMGSQKKGKKGWLG